MPSESWFIVLLLFLCLVGIGISFLPNIPGIFLNFIALLLMHYKYGSFSKTFLLSWLVVGILVVVIDCFMPVWFAKKYGFTSYSSWFGLVGMILGLFFTPVGMVLGMLIGALAGEMFGGSEKATVVKVGLAAFFGSMISVILKLIASIVLSIYIFIELTRVA